MTRIDDLALLSDLQTASLVDRDGTVLWACFPTFDSTACFAAVLGDEENGRWRIAPTDPQATSERRYRSGLVLETTWSTESGKVAVIDFMPPRESVADLVRIVVGLEGSVELTTDLVIRFDYGSVVPWVQRTDHGDLLAVAGPDKIRLRTPAELHGEGLHTMGTVTVEAGDRVPFLLDWRPSHVPLEEPPDPEDLLRATEEFWDDWIGTCSYDDFAAEAVKASLVVLKGLTFAPTGGIVAAPTTSLPELIGGERNWDYRYCWLRDATYALLALLEAGYLDEAVAWRNWLVRATAGQAEQLQIMYGIHGERRLTEYELPWLDGHRGSQPVRIGNAAHLQFQLDVFGEVMDALHQARVAGADVDDEAWALECLIIDVVEARWREPDEGIWEIRGPRQHFTHSKLMAWVAVDRAVQAVEDFGLDGPVERWRSLREEIRADICTRGVDERGVFVQAYGSPHLDASLLLVPIVGFLPADDPRVVATTDAIMRDLTIDGLVKRYHTSTGIDGLRPGEGAFFLCSFWLVDNLAMQGRTDEAKALFERLLEYRNDVGLLAEQVDPATGELLGNMPQAFSHLGVVNSAFNLCASQPGASEKRSHTGENR